MSTNIMSAAVLGLDAEPVEVEADIAQGLPNFIIVGLPDASVQESRERVRAAIRNAQLPFPRTRLTVNLAPADVRKEGPAYDLPIAIAILEAADAIPATSSARRLFIGELALDGSVRPVVGTLPIALMAAACGYTEVYLPAGNAAEAALASNITLFPVRSLGELVAHLRGDARISPQARTPWNADALPVAAVDFADIRGQAHAKRALEIAAAGGHNVLFTGPPGSGKTLLARATPSIMPPMTQEEALEVTKIASVAGAISGTILASARPFRAPHHTASSAAMIGGGTFPRPGEVSLAHRGVLFLDEFPEFPRGVVEALRQPLEDGIVTVVRAGGRATFPAKFMLIAARNPCPCGFASDPERLCVCPPSRVASYARRLSGPILDRMDLHVEVPRMRSEEMLATTKEERSFAVRERVTTARTVQRERLAPHGMFVNAEIGHALLTKTCPIDAEGERILRAAIARLLLSARAIMRVLRVARTIADLDGAERVGAAHIAEAIHYRERY